MNYNGRDLNRLTPIDKELLIEGVVYYGYSKHIKGGYGTCSWTGVAWEHNTDEFLSAKDFKPYFIRN